MGTVAASGGSRGPCGPAGAPVRGGPPSRHLLLVAEGPGIAALRLLIDEAIRDVRSVVLLYGARTAGEVYPSSLLPDEVEYVVATDDGSLGHRGSMADLVMDYEGWADQSFAAGPPALLGRLAQLAEGRRGRLGVATLGRKRGGGRPPAPGSSEARRKSFLQVALGQSIGCAAGTCQGCAVPGSSGSAQRVCQRGRSSPRTSSHGESPREGAVHVKAKRRANVARAMRTPTVRKVKPAISSPGPRVSPLAAQGSVRRTSVEPVAAGGTAVSSGLALDALGGRPVDLAVDLGNGLVLANPVLVAAGPFGYGVEVADMVDLGRLGGLVTRGTSFRPRAGHAAPRTVEVPAGLLMAPAPRTSASTSCWTATPRHGRAGRSR